jgi:tetratricopeptide (TPR) repeat protein
MSPLEKVNHLLTSLKNCSAAEINTYFDLLLEVFPTLNQPEKKEIAKGFYTWVEENSAKQPLKFAYAKYLLALEAFFGEDYEAALRLGAEAHKLFTEQSEPDGVALASGLLGATYRTLGTIDLALKELWEAYDQLKKSLKYKHNTMACAFQIASIYTELKNHEEALPLFETVLKMALQEKNAIWIVNSSHGLGKVYLMQKNYAEAKKVLDNAMLVSDQQNNFTLIALSLTELANYHFQLGNYSEAEQMHKRALEIREQHNFIGGAITNCILLADIYKKQSRQDEAVSLLEKGLKLAEQIKVKPKMYQVHLLLSEIYKDKSDLGKSLFHYKLFHQLREEVEQEYNASKIKNMKLIFEAEQTRKENIIIKKQKAEIETKNIELQETIDELTRTKVGKKAKAFTLIIAIALFIIEEIILHSVLHLLPQDNFYFSLFVKMIIIFSLKPIDSAIEHYLLKKIIRKQKKEILV